MPRRPRGRGRLIALGAAALVVTLPLALALHYRSIVSRIVTAMAWKDAERLATEFSELRERDPKKLKDCIDTLANTYRESFRKGYFDHNYALRRLPPDAVSLDSVPVWLLIVSYYEVLEEVTEEAEWGVDETAREVMHWLEPVALYSRGKEALVNLLTSDYTALATSGDDREGSLWKRGLLYCLYHTEVLEIRRSCLERLGPEHWAAVLRDCRHPREKVRAGALLLLYHHPSEERFVATARQALDDPSEWVRLAAASTLALDGWNQGAELLRRGLDHERWEIRFWCAVALLKCSGDTAEPGEHLTARQGTEPDRWLKSQFRELVRDWKKVPLKRRWAFGRGAATARRQAPGGEPAK